MVLSSEKTKKRVIMKKKVTTMAMACMALVLASCSTTKKTANDSVAKGDMEISRNDELMDPGYLILSDAQRQLVSQNNQFALKLFGEVSDMGSKVVSPMSVTYLMAMLANGADGATKQEILKTIGAENMPVDEMNDFYHHLMGLFKKEDPSTALNMANYVAVNKNFKLKSPFVTTLQDSYLAGVESLDFQKNSTLGHINGWCKKQTGGMIPSIVDEIDASAVSYIMNAIYFNGTWKDKFDKKNTLLERFQGYTRDVKRAQMMHRSDEYDYFSNDTYSAVEMPYGNGSFCMTVLLPNADKSIADMLKQLTADGLQEMRNRKMENCVVDLKLPRFTTALSLPLNDVISKLGAPTMFTGSADFSKFANGNLAISKMLQKAKIEVAEEGTKAAAVTIGMVAMTALRPQPRHVEFYANRPFVYFITERSTGAILFMGQFTGDSL